MMIDTHCHLSDNDYDDLMSVIERMGDNIMIASGCDKKTNLEVIELVNKYPNIYGTIGFHPTELDDITLDDLSILEEQAKNPKIVGIGEIGLDYHYDDTDIVGQKEFFIKQIELAHKLDLPIVIHSRDAALDTYEILKEHLKGKAVMHCYSYSEEMAHRFLDLGLYFGIGGVLTFKNSVKLKETVKELPLDRLLLETDSPFLAPEPLRGTTNEPYNIYYVGLKIAELKGIFSDLVFETTTSNARKIFNL